MYYCNVKKYLVENIRFFAISAWVGKCSQNTVETGILALWTGLRYEKKDTCALSKVLQLAAIVPSKVD
jgi:hypothetical protein